MKARHLVWLRRITQTLFLCFFLYLLIVSRLPQDIYLNYSLAFSNEQELRLEQPVTFFFQLDPLVGISSLLSGQILIKGFLWGAVIVILTILLGRIFCSFLCPLGTIHHVIGSVKPALKGSQMVLANQKTPSQRIKYFIVILLLAASILGINMAGLLDPIALLFRSIALAVLPGISRSGATIATGLLIGVDKVAATRFSFLMVLPPIIGASLAGIWLLAASLPDRLGYRAHISVDFVSEPDSPPFLVSNIVPVGGPFGDFLTF